MRTGRGQDDDELFSVQNDGKTGSLKSDQILDSGTKLHHSNRELQNRYAVDYANWGSNNNFGSPKFRISSVAGQLLHLVDSTTEDYLLLISQTPYPTADEIVK